MSRINNFDGTLSHPEHLRGIMGLLKETRSKYEFLASSNLRELLRIYYKREPMEQEEWSRLLDDIHNSIINDFTELTEEYNELTTPIH